MGVRRWQNEDGSYKPGGAERYYKAQKKESKLIKKSDGKKYQSLYDKADQYRSKSKAIKRYAKELQPLSEKVKDLYFQQKDLEERDDVRNEALDQAIDLASKTPNWDQLGEKYQDDLVDRYLYEEGIMDNVIRKKNKELVKKYDDAMLEYKSKCKEAADHIIGDFGETKLSDVPYVKDVKYKEFVTYALSKQNTMWMMDNDDRLGRK